MNLLKAVFTNALVLATLVTSLAGTILVAYAVDKPRAAGQAPAMASSTDNAAPHAQDVPSTPSEAAASTWGSGERTPPIIFWGTAVPAGSYLDAML